MKSAIGTIDEGDSLISLSLKPRTNWNSLCLAVFHFCVALMGVTALAIEIVRYMLDIHLYNTGIISEAPVSDISWWFIAITVLTVGFGINETAKARKHAWLTVDINKDINSNDVVILKPISKSDLGA